MTSPLKIYKAGSDILVTSLGIGEHSIGRGPLLQCEDKRISRQHALIHIDNEEVFISSVHTNPCFYRDSLSTTVVILPKNKPQGLKHGDRFGLLPEAEYWFEVKFTNEPNTLTGDENKNFETPSTSKPSDCSPNGKRELEEEFDEESDEVNSSKRLKVDQQFCPIEIKAEPFADNNENIASVTNDENHATELSNQTVEFKVKVEPSINNEGNEVASTSIFATATSQLSSEAVKVKAEPSSNNEENETANIKVEHFVNDNSSVEKMEKISDDESADENAACSSAKDEKTDVLNGETSAQNNTGPKQNSDKANFRDRCWYGSSCYRKNTSHRKDYSHPDDSDYDSDPDDDRPACEYGASCYRTNKQHRLDMKHPKTNTKLDDGKKTVKRKRKIAKKVQPSTSAHSSDEDDYDLEDPFLNDDSSDDFEPSDLDSSDETDSGHENDEDVKRLLKEAKRITRGRK